MAVVWLVSTRDPGDRSGAVKSDSDSQTYSKKGYKKKQFPPSKKKRESKDSKDSGEEEEESPPKSILKQPNKDEEEDEKVHAPGRSLHVDFDVKTPPSKDRSRANPPTPHPSALRKTLAPERMDPIPVPEELKKTPSKPAAPVPASSTSKPGRKAVQQKPGPPSVPEPATDEQPQQQQQQPHSSAKPSATKKTSKSKPKQVASSAGECIEDRVN